GKFQTLKDFVDHRGYALYRLFHAKNKRGVYTFIDLQHVKKLSLNIQLIQDGKPNALIYDRDIKNQGGVAGHVAKRILNTLWGALCQKKRNYKTLTANNQDSFIFPEGEILDSIIPVGKDQ
ncbi:hypothetical protein C1646_730764, partial [Rhizophagus diaphanus]